MADIRTLKLNLLADVSNFNKGLTGANRASKTFAGRVGLTMRKAAQGFLVAEAAVAALAIRLGVDSVKGAMEDEAAQKSLQAVLKKTTGATDVQVASTEKWISKMQFATGFSDTQLRGSLKRLVASTHDVTKAEKLSQLAMDVSRGTGKDLEAVTMAIGKAYDGNVGALKRLGVPLDANIVKTKDSKAALDELAKLYGGQASTYAETFAGKIDRLNQFWGEFKDGLGGVIITKLTDILPYIERVAAKLGGNEDTSLSNKIKSVRRGLDGGEQSGADSLATSLQNVATAFTELFNAFAGDNARTTNSRLQGMADAMNNIAGAINAIGNAYKSAYKFFDSPAWKKGVDYWWGPKGTSELGQWGNFFSALTGSRAAGGPVSGNHSYLVGEKGPEIFTPNTGGKITANHQMGSGVTIVLNGVVDAESARRSIERLIQQSQRRTGAINWAGAIA